MDESHWIARAQTAEAKLNTLEAASKPALEKIKQFKSNFGVKERQDGEIVIDFDKFVKNLGQIAALELRGIIDGQYQISGDAGEKPHMRLVNDRSV